MDVQSLSIVVPGGCPNRCCFCVSDLHPNPLKNQIEENLRFYDLYRRDFIQRLMFARDNGCNTVMLTGNGEPLINKSFLKSFSEWNWGMPSPFRWIEIQTSGVTLDEEKLRWLRNTIGVSTISLSISDVFSSAGNANYNRTPEKLIVDIDALCAEIKRYDFNLRLSLNMTDVYNGRPAQEIFDRCKQLGANQITFRVLYTSPHEDPHGIDAWIREHRCVDTHIEEIKSCVREYGHVLERLPFGALRYSVNGMSVVVDDDCMSTEDKNEVKYLILQPNCKLYTKWDDEGSILF